MYAVMGITGDVGGAVARTLLAKGEKVRGIVRNPEKAVEWQKQGAELFKADYDDVDALTAAFTGVAGVFVMVPPNFAPAPDFAETRAALKVLYEALSRALPSKAVYLSSILSGQGCITLKRLFVHESIYQALTEALISCAQHQKLGDGFDPETTLGPIQNRPQFARMQTTWHEIQEAKAPILYQGEVPSEGAGLFFPVTLLDNPPAEAAYVIRENFGPLRAVIKYQDLDEAVRLANGTPYGLGASVWGKDPGHWTPLHAGLMPGLFGSINTSMPIPTFRSVVIRIQE